MYWEELPKWVRNKFTWKGCVCRFIYDGIEGEVEIIDYVDGRLGIKYLDKDISYILVGNFKKCKISVLIGKIIKTHIYDIGEVVNNLKITKKISSKNRDGRRYECECVECGFNSDMEYYKNGVPQQESWSISEYSLSGGVSCPCCCNTPKVAVACLNSIYKTSPWMIELGVNEEESKRYTRTSENKIKVKCSDCGCETHKRIGNIYNRKSISCDCGDGVSYPEKFMSSVLNQLSVSYNKQLTKRSYKWCDKYRYDFLIGENIIIETHGMQHYENVKGKFRKSLKEEQENDKLKINLAWKNGIKEYIVIDCRYSDLEFIKNNILNSRLVELYDLSQIDWNKAGEYAMSNLSKKACDLWNENNNISTTDISTMMNVSSKTIRLWLEKWSKLGLCDYTRENMKTKSNLKISKSIEIFKDNISLGIFPSITDLERRSLCDFGVNLNSSSISRYLKNDYYNTNTYKGFTFKIIERDVYTLRKVVKHV